MDFPPKDFELDGANFCLSYRSDNDIVVADLNSTDGLHSVAAEVISLGWKLAPVQFLTKLSQRQAFSYGGFCSVEYEQGKAELSVDEQFEDVDEKFFVDLSWEVVFSYVELLGSEQIGWWKELPPSLQAKILDSLG